MATTTRIQMLHTEETTEVQICPQQHGIHMPHLLPYSCSSTILLLTTPNTNKKNVHLH